MIYFIQESDPQVCNESNANSIQGDNRNGNSSSDEASFYINYLLANYYKFYIYIYIYMKMISIIDM